VYRLGEKTKAPGLKELTRKKVIENFGGCLPARSMSLETY